MDAVVAFIANGEPITMWLRIVATVALQDVGPSAASPRTATGLRKQRLETRPQRIVQERLCHARPYQVDRASTRDRSEALKRALHAESHDCHADRTGYVVRGSQRREAGDILSTLE